MDQRSAGCQVLKEGDEELRLYGYRRDLRRTVLTWLTISLTAFFLRIVFHWKPGWFLKATHNPTSLRLAEKVLVEDQYGRVWVHRIRLTTRDGTEVKLMKPRFWKRLFSSTRDSVYQMDTTFQDDSLIRYFINKKLKYSWNWNEDSFERIKTLDEAVPDNFHSLPHLSFRQAMQRRVLYGLNVIDVPITPLIKVLLLQALHPFYVFQVFSCTLWYFDEYWQYATCIVIESILSLSLAVFETRRNERTLRNTITSSGLAIVQREGEFREMSSELLVPGDIVEIPRSGCDMMCDAVLICGNAIVNESMLTGESVPVSKVPLPLMDELPEVEVPHHLDVKEKQRHVLFNGTRVIQTRNYEGERVRAVVLRTGFTTAKGELVRAIMFPKPRQYKFDQDILHYLIVLCIFGAAGFIFTVVLMVSYKKPGHLIARRALDIITVIVPPALPAAMSVGLVLSLRRLKANRIFCIAPRVINASGSVDVVAFDKTGTLTEEGLDLRRVLYPEAGVLAEEGEPRRLSPTHPVVRCMAAAHSLAKIDKSLCGDPIDIKMFEAIGWRLEEPVLGQESGEGDTVQQMVPRVVTFQAGERNEGVRGLTHSIGLLREFPFSSSLQRMAVIGRVLGDSQFSAYVKGSPEAVHDLCQPDTVPSDLDARLAEFTARGYRVLALAWRPMEKLSLVRVHRIARVDVERDLRFVGLLVMENRLKPESTPTITQLKTANLRIVMVTGDNILTALSVAHDCGIIESEDRVVSVTTRRADDLDKLDVVYQEIGQTRKSATSESEDSVIDNLLVASPSHKRDSVRQPKRARLHLAITGKTWGEIRLHRPELLPKLVVMGSVFARFSPDQKAQLIEEIQSVDYSVVMCGDGANDCGALKAAHTGLSLSEAEASVASPFTSKVQNISCVLQLIREGRCALVTSFGIFKYMANYSITQFITVLILYTLKLNLSDGQFLYIDLIIITSLSITFGYTLPAPGLNPLPPPSRLISIPTILSIILLQLVNLGFQLGALLFIENQPWFQPRDEKKAVIDEEYDSYENTVIFIVSAFQYITLAFIFAKGAPYRRNVHTNYLFVVNLLVLLFFTLFIAIDPFPGLKKWLELVDTPIRHSTGKALSFRGLLVGLASANFFLCAIIEWSVDSLTFRRFLRRLSEMGILRSGKPPRHKVLTNLVNDHSWPLVELERFSTTHQTGLATADDVWEPDSPVPTKTDKSDNVLEMQERAHTRV